MDSRWLWPGHRTLLEVDTIVVSWWIVVFCAVKFPLSIYIVINREFKKRWLCWVLKLHCKLWRSEYKCTPFSLSWMYCLLFVRSPSCSISLLLWHLNLKKNILILYLCLVMLVWMVPSWWCLAVHLCIMPKHFAVLYNYVKKNNNDRNTYNYAFIFKVITRTLAQWSVL